MLKEIELTNVEFKKITEIMESLLHVLNNYDLDLGKIAIATLLAYNSRGNKEEFMRFMSESWDLDKDAKNFNKDQ